MTALLITLTAVIAVALPALLVLTLVAPSLRLWPTPGVGSWQSYVFWPLFRSLNVLCFALALTDRTPWLGLPFWLRLLALALSAASLALFFYSFWVLGRDNSYGGRQGLVTDGIYRWTRNPQNAMLIVVYGSLALAADSASTYLACAAMMAVYVAMVLAEEPWLEAVYGEPYRSYCRSVPRFFHWRRAMDVVRSLR